MAETHDTRAPFIVEAFGSETLPSQAPTTAAYIAQHTLSLTNAPACVVCGLDRPRGRLTLLAALGLDGVATCLCVEPSDPEIAKALAGEASADNDLEHDVDSRRCAFLRSTGFTSRVVIPLTLDDGPAGVMQVLARDGREFGAAEVDALRWHGRIAAAAIDNARKYDRAGTLFALTQSLSTTLELKQVGDFIAENVAKAMGAKGCSLRSLDRMTRHLEIVGSYGLSRKYLVEKGPVIADEDSAGILAGKPVLMADVAHDPRVQYPAAAMEEGIRSMASVPMVVKGVVTGVLTVCADQPYDFARDDVAFLAATAGVAGAAIENARLYDGIRQDFEVLLDEIVFMRRAARAVGGSKEARA